MAELNFSIGGVSVSVHSADADLLNELRAFNSNLTACAIVWSLLSMDIGFFHLWRTLRDQRRDRAIRRHLMIPKQWPDGLTQCRGLILG